MSCVLRSLFMSMSLRGRAARGRHYSRCRYQLLSNGDDVHVEKRQGTGAKPRIRRWARRSNGVKVLGFRVSSSKRRLNWRGFSFLLLPRRLCRIYEGVVAGIMALEGVYPTIAFSTQWGLPVLSHPSTAINL